MGIFDKFFSKPTPPKSDPAPPAEPLSRLGELSKQAPFPLSVHRGDRVEAGLLALRASGNSDGIAVILGDEVATERTFDLWDEPYSIEEQQAKLQQADFPLWIAETKAGEDFEDDEEIDHEEINPAGTAPMNSLTVGRSYKDILPEVFIARLPTHDPVMIPLQLRFGDWNACPAPWVHAAAARYWGERFGATIATAAGDIIEYFVERPPATDAEAMELAWQQYYYCPDIVTQGVGSVATLAQALKGSTRWYFWWD